MHRFALRTGAALAVTVAAALAALLLSAGSASAADGPWSGSGTGNATVTADGNGNPVFDYYNAIGRSGSWTFSNTAETARTESIEWDYRGFHSWYRVTVKLESFVMRDGQEFARTVRSAGPVDCCAAPSGGFHYSGVEKFVLQRGDVYGFRMSGSNYDNSDPLLSGTLAVKAQESSSQPAGPGHGCGWGFCGQW